MANSWLAESWAQEFVQVLQLVTMQEFTVALAEVSVPKLDGPSWWGQAFNVAPTLPLLIGAGSEACKDLVKRTLEGSEAREVEDGSAKTTFFELVQQSLGALARAISTRTGYPVECGSGSEQHHPAVATAYRAVVSRKGAELPALYIHIPPQLERILESRELTALAVKTFSPGVAAPSPTSDSGKDSSVDLLLDVEMPVSISFGHAHLPLRDVLRFTSGSVVELNRRPEDPVEIVVNNCVIARGEVVVIDGNYGVRIQEIVSRQQRLAVRTADRGVAPSR